MYFCPPPKMHPIPPPQFCCAETAYYKVPSVNIRTAFSLGLSRKLRLGRAALCLSCLDVAANDQLPFSSPADFLTTLNVPYF